MVTLTLTWDAESMLQIERIANYRSELRQLYADLAEAYGHAGVEFIRPEVKGNGKWQASTGATERGIDYEVETSGDGLTVYFLGNNIHDGHNVANMIDVGNFDPGDELYAWSYGYRGFPISGRMGSVNQFLAVIHGMGSSSPEYPKHFSGRGVDHLDERTPVLAEQALQDLLDRLVI